MNILSIRVRDVVFSHEKSNHIMNRGPISLEKLKDGVQMFNKDRGCTIFIPINNVLWIVTDNVGSPKKNG